MNKKQDKACLDAARHRHQGSTVTDGVDEFDLWVADTHLMVCHYRRQVTAMVSALSKARDVLVRSARITLHDLLPYDKY